MTYCFRGWFRRITSLMIPLLVGVGCVTTPTSEPTLPPPEASFTAFEIPGKVFHGETSDVVLEKDHNVPIQVDDRIQLEETGQGILQFQDRLAVRMFRRTEIHLVDANEDLSGSTSVNLFLSYGNTLVRLNEEKTVWLVLKTDYATLTTLLPGTDFVVCHTQDVITCGVVNEGAVEFQAQGVKKTAKKGEAIYVRPGEPPSDAICAQQDEVEDWLNRIQGTGESKPLGAIVAGWPQEPCSAAPQESPVPEATPLPSLEGMVRIDAGLYEIGRSDASEFYVAPQEISLVQYWIDQFEVTNAQYQKFLDETGHQPPAISPGEDNHPVKGVTWDDAASFCAWANKRLPTEAEWEVAARGPGPNPPLYPWGSDPLAGGQVDDLPRTSTYEVGIFPFNKSPFGIYDMAGNVWEWVGDPYDGVPEGNRILRGGRHGFQRDMAFRQPAGPADERFVPFAGLRCATDRAEGE
jgi:formylglycine-generating enzyme required for sulfatase activity